MWLRAHARKRRWDEEITLVPFEMACTERALDKKVTDWESLALAAEHPGHRAYAHRQAAVWRGLRDHSAKMFSRVRVANPLPVVGK